jgi:hypothetical protein
MCALEKLTTVQGSAISGTYPSARRADFARHGNSMAIPIKSLTHGKTFSRAHELKQSLATSEDTFVPTSWLTHAVRKFGLPSWLLCFLKVAHRDFGSLPGTCVGVSTGRH